MEPRDSWTAAFGLRRAAGAAAPSIAALSALARPPRRIEPAHCLREAEDIDLVAGRHVRWSVADQGWRNTCVAFAVTSCLELVRAGSAEEFEPLSPQFLYWHMRQRPPANPPPGWHEGATKLAQAKQVLMETGICRAGSCWTRVAPLLPLEGTQPSKDATAEAAKLRLTEIHHEDYPDPASRPSGIARKVHARLAHGFPVAIAVPVFAKTSDSPTTNWDNPEVERSGRVRNPPAGWVPSGAPGHAVCVVGFQRDADEPTGGWFIFRNSLGLDWAEDAITAAGRPRVPHRGFGAISATYVEQYLWEMLSPGRY
jgi:hypothetical protein